MWIALDRYRLWQHARIEIKGYQYNAQQKAGQPPKKDMLIMSEVGRSSLAFNARGTRCNSLFTSFCPACCHFICLLFFPLDLSIFPSPAPPWLPLPGPCGIETLTQQRECRGDEPLLCAFNQSLLGGQKKWSLKVPRGASPQAAAWQDLRPVLPSFYI